MRPTRITPNFARTVPLHGLKRLGHNGLKRVEKDLVSNSAPWNSFRYPREWRAFYTTSFPRCYTLLPMPLSGGTIQIFFYSLVYLVRTTPSYRNYDATTPRKGPELRFPGRWCLSNQTV